MKIAFIVNDFPAYSETFILNQIVFLIQCGHDVKIFARSPQLKNKCHEDYYTYQLDRKVQYLLPEGPVSTVSLLLQTLGSIAVIGLKRPEMFCRLLRHARSIWNVKIARFRIIGMIRLFLTEDSFDVIHCHFGHNGMVGLYLKKVGVVDAKIISTFHGSDINSIPQLYGHGIYTELFRLGEIFTVNSSFSFNRLKMLGCQQQKIIKLPVGVDLNKFPEPAKKNGENSTVHIVTVARLVEVKGLEFSIKAIALVVKKYSALKYAIIGDGPLHQQLLHLVEKLQMENHVSLLGAMPQEGVGDHYQKADIFLYSGVITDEGAQEAQGLSIIEAQAAGLPVVATDVGGVAESIINGVSGFLVPERNPAAMAEKLLYVLENKDLWPQIGQAGRRHVMKNFDNRKLGNQLLGLYEQLC